MELFGSVMFTGYGTPRPSAGWEMTRAAGGGVLCTGAIDVCAELELTDRAQRSDNRITHDL